ncbi:MAG: hypothetical protein V3W06_04705 [Acidimicrobiia bacterium]
MPAPSDPDTKLSAPPKKPLASRSVLAFAGAAAAIVLLLVGGTVLLSSFLGDETQPAVTQPTISVTTVPSTITTPATTMPPLIEALPPAVITLSATPDVDPVRVSTVLGDLEFTTLQFPAGYEFDGVAWTPYGLVAVGDSGLLWSSDYLTWHSVPILVDPALFDFRGLIVVGDDVVVNGGFTAVRFAWDGTGWTEQGRQEFPDRVDEIVFGPRGAVALAWGEQTETGFLFNGTIFSSSDGVHFTEAERPPGKDLFVAAENVPDDDRDLGGCRRTAFAAVGKIDTVLATDAGFVALTSASHPRGLICDPLLWFSPDGNTWELVSPDSPFEKMAIIDGIDERAGRFVATGGVGGQGKTEGHAAAWVSDDGLMWQLVDSPPAPGEVIVGEMGWVSLGAAGEGDALYPAMWFSTDGLTWDGPYDGPEGIFGQPYRGAQVVVGPDAIFAIGVGPDYARIPIVGRLQD